MTEVEIKEAARQACMAELHLEIDASNSWIQAIPNRVSSEWDGSRSGPSRLLPPYQWHVFIPRPGQCPIQVYVEEISQKNHLAQVRSS